MNKKRPEKFPAFQFYIGDWKKDLGIQTLESIDRYVWLECLFLMHESEERGVLVLNGKPMNHDQIARAINLDKQVVTKALTNIKDNGVCGVREDGAIFSRRMVKDEEIRQKRIKAGTMGGNPKLLKQNSSKEKINVNQIPEDEYEIENEDLIKKNGAPSVEPPAFQKLGLIKISDHVFLTEISRDMLKKRCLDEGFDEKDRKRIIELLDRDFEKNPEKRGFRDHFKDLISWPLDDVRLKKAQLERARGSPKQEPKRAKPAIYTPEWEKPEFKPGKKTEFERAGKIIERIEK